VGTVGHTSAQGGNHEPSDFSRASSLTGRRSRVLAATFAFIAAAPASAAVSWADLVMPDRRSPPRNPRPGKPQALTSITGTASSNADADRIRCASPTRRPSRQPSRRTRATHSCSCSTRVGTPSTANDDTDGRAQRVNVAGSQPTQPVVRGSVSARFSNFDNGPRRSRHLELFTDTSRGRRRRRDTARSTTSPAPLQPAPVPTRSPSPAACRLTRHCEVPPTAGNTTASGLEERREHRVVSDRRR